MSYRRVPNIGNQAVAISEDVSGENLSWALRPRDPFSPARLVPARLPAPAPAVSSVRHPRPAILERLEFRETVLAPGFAELLDAPVDLLSIARAAIREGDELHNRLSSATTLLHALLTTRKGDSDSAKAALRTVAEAPLYFLNLWMPACQLMLLAGDDEPGCTLVTRLCANGEVIGIQISSLPGQWFTAPSPVVKGPFMKGPPPDPQFGPATGDSGVIDAFGLGGTGPSPRTELVECFFVLDGSGR